MVNSILHFFMKIITIIIVIVTAYFLLIFLFPDTADTYWDKNFNNILRNFKEKSFQISSPDGSLKLSF